MDRIPDLHRHTKKVAKDARLPGVIVSLTTVRHPPAGFGTESYTIALIERTDGSRVLAQLTKETSDAGIGDSVAPCLRHLRTMANGLKVHDIKYRVTAKAGKEPLVMKSYILAVSGPSGVGKTTIAAQLLSLFSSYAEQVPIYTTRKPKAGDIEPYVHVSKQVFDAMVARKEIVSHTTMASVSEDRQYGYRKKDIEAIWGDGKLPIVVTELHLLKGLVESFGRRAILSCGLLPPGRSKRHMLSALLHRLRGRGRETTEQIEERLKVAETDLKHFEEHEHLFDHIFVNDELAACVEQIGSVAIRK
ncbi:MAG: OB-fold domain-containing protein [Candidatus Peribacteraceae bacterium]